MTHPPALIADIGGTHARFALVIDDRITQIDVLRTADYPGIAAAATAYLHRHGATVRHAALSVAAPLPPAGDAITLANLPGWNTSQSALQQDLALDTLFIINDFAALAYGVAALESAGATRLCGGSAVAGAPIGLIGPGTGLGMAGVIFVDGQPQVIASEGGNATLPATTLREYMIIDRLRILKGDGHVSAEDAVSGTGLPLLYQAIAQLDGRECETRDAAAIVAAARSKTCPVAIEALDLFCHWLGVMAGNLALTLNAAGGIYIAGGIVPQWLDDFRHSRFTASFSDKGAYRDYLSGIPVFVVTHPYPALEGMRALLAGRRG